ncbi:glycosyltransferase family 2 protein [Candidatus Saccharibacteria bacterium]|nr:glycosyltransferase family 2 protein [Candidatus Saccharibacteria bacterium]
MAKSKHPSVFVVTPIFNRKEHTLAFLKTLFENDYPNFTMVIVDDGSTDGSSEAIKAKFPKTTILKGTGSLYWTGCTNLGVDYALKHGADYIITVNNDVELRSSWISELVECAQKNPKALVGSLIYFMNDRKRVWYFGADFNYETGELYHKEDEPKSKRPIESKWLTGMGVLIPAGAFKDVGHYDIEKFPQYFADADFSLRAAKKGYKLLVTPKAVLYNDSKSDSGGKLMAQYKLRAVPKLLFTPYFSDSIKVRKEFYRRYFGEDYKKIYRHYYRHRWAQFYGPYVRHCVRLKLVRIAKWLGVKK